MDLPIASQSQIDQMNREAAKKMQQEGIEMIEEQVGLTAPNVLILCRTEVL